VEMIVFRAFQPGDEEAFRLLNEEWIWELFAMEEKDHEVLGDPVTHILNPGGAIYMVEDNERVIGCCALLAMGDGSFELAKMTISGSYRGRGIGKNFLRYVISEAQQMGARRVYLETSRKLPDAIHLYEAAGFRHIPAERLEPSPYTRTDVFMELLCEELVFKEVRVR
jgi:putative acetyltransferase